MKRAITDVLLLGVLSLGLGFGMNSVRGSKHIDPTKKYFEKSARKSAKADAPETAKPVAPPAPQPLTPTTPARAEPATSVPPKPATGEAPKPPKKLEHPYQEIELDEVAKVFKDPGTKQGLNIFVDARKEDLYVEGHIPGAMHCDPYDAAAHVDAVLARTNGVERVIVYCGGGDCEDSIFLCRELIDAGVPEDSVFLFPGGWKEWNAKQLPVETGGHD
jgi:rhodanese-related sulfurtransferase